MRRFLLILLLLVAAPQALAQKKFYLEEIRKSAEKCWKDNPEIIEQWEKTSKQSPLWGYDRQLNFRGGLRWSEPGVESDCRRSRKVPDRS